MKSITRPLSRKLFQELASRARRSEPDRQAAEFIAKHTISGGKLPSALQIKTTPEPTPEEMSNMTIDERVQNFMTLLGRPLTTEEWEERQVIMKELEKLPREELLRRYKSIVGDSYQK